MDWNKLTDDETLIAEKAVAMARAVKLAGDRAPHGKGLFCLEQAVEDSTLSVIADRAKWIWDQAARRLPKAHTQWIVDVYHVSQHIHACGKELYGDGSPGAKAWSADQLERLIDLGGPRFIEQMDPERNARSDAAHVRAIDKLRGYLAENLDRLWYRQRLSEGRPIGSGLIEGACKNTIGARLKLNSARWRIQRAEHMGALRCLQYSNLRDAYWLGRAA